MKDDLKLYMIMLGCEPVGRNTEQHDVYFGIAHNMKELLPDINAFWADAKDIHIDAWREVTVVDGFAIKVSAEKNENPNQLFFVNLGGYSRGSFNELHECDLFVAETLGKAVKNSKESDFYKNKTFSGAVSHIDDKFAVDVDNACTVSELITDHNRKGLFVNVDVSEKVLNEDKLHIGYLKLDKMK